MYDGAAYCSMPGSRAALASRLAGMQDSEFTALLGLIDSLIRRVTLTRDIYAEAENTAEAAVRTDTLIRWPAVPGAALYQVYARRTDAPDWGDPIALLATESPSGALPRTPDADRTFTHTANLRGDDWFFGVSACAADGACSPVASAVPGGAFVPLTPAQGDNR